MTSYRKPSPAPARFSVHPAPDARDPAIAELLQMHTSCRPAGGASVKAFCARYLDSMPGMQRDKAGNRFLRIGAAPVLWSSHTDTVHRRDGTQRLVYGAGILTVAAGENSACLGADDSAGVWIMRQMILRNIPGLYVFHDSEEIGGLGSAWIARHNPRMLDGIEYAIALDRKGTGDVITHQGGRCCSDEFAEALALRLGGRYLPDDTGTFTDTANYTDYIPECTNLSVGYSGAHTGAESLDVGHVAWLLERLCQLDVSALPVSRDPDAMEIVGRWGDIEAPGRSVEDYAYNYPQIAAELLEECGITPALFEAAIRRWHNN